MDLFVAVEVEDGRNRGGGRASVESLGPGVNETPAAEPGTRAKSDSEDVPGIDSHAVTLSPWETWVTALPASNPFPNFVPMEFSSFSKKTPGVDVPTVAAMYKPDVDVSGVDEAKIVRRIDWRLLPWLSFLYLLSFLDRTSIGNARVRWSIYFLLAAPDVYLQRLYHLGDDLHLSDKQYLLCLAIFYFNLRLRLCHNLCRWILR